MIFEEEKILSPFSDSIRAPTGKNTAENIVCALRPEVLDKSFSQIHTGEKLHSSYGHFPFHPSFLLTCDLILAQCHKKETQSRKHYYTVNNAMWPSEAKIV